MAGRSSVTPLQTNDPSLRHWRFDLYLLAPLALGALLFSPFLLQGIPNSADGMLHLFRVALWSEAWAQGSFWPRWHTALYDGLGYPLFNFYAPLLYVLGGVLGILAPATIALKAVLFVTCLAYPVGMYLWMRDIFSRLAGVAGAAAYTFASIRFFELFVQGNYAQFLAWSIFPWVLFFWRRLVHDGSRGTFAGAVLALSALLLSHNISAMLFAPFAAVYVLWQAIAARNERPWARLLLASLCAGMIALAFWLPALAETRYVSVHVLTQGYFAVKEHFITLAEMLTATPLLDVRSANPTPPYNIGQVVLMPALLGTLLVLRPALARGQRGHLVFALAAGIIAGFMMLPPSLVIWETIPLIAFAEFPTRMYGVLTLFVALLAGASLEWVAGHWRVQGIAAIIFVFGMIMTTMNQQLPRNFQPVTASTAELGAYEDDYHTPGTTSAGEYLSAWMQSLPDEDMVSDEGARLALIAPPQGMAGEVVRVLPEALSLHVTSESAGLAPVAQFYFPGWLATVNGSPVAIEPCTDAGLICVPVSGGESTIELVYAGTPIQHTGEAVGLAGLALLLGVLVLGVPGKPARISLTAAPKGPAFALTALILSVLLVKVLWISPFTTLFRFASPQGIALPATHQANIAMGEHIRLIGWDIFNTEATQGDEMRVRLYWQADAPLPDNYLSFVQLIAQDQQEYGASNNMNPGNVPTRAWNSDFYIIDDHSIKIDDDVPPIVYTLRVGLSPSKNEQSRIGETDLSPSVRVLAGKAATPDSTARSVDATFANAVQLQASESAVGGDVLALTLYWRADEAVPPGQQIFVHVLDDTGTLIAQSDGAPIGGLYPPELWKEGETVLDERTIVLGRGAEPASILVGMYDLQSGVRTSVSGASANPAGDAVILP